MFDTGKLYIAKDVNLESLDGPTGPRLRDEIVMCLSPKTYKWVWERQRYVPSIVTPPYLEFTLVLTPCGVGVMYSPLLVRY